MIKSEEEYIDEAIDAIRKIFKNRSSAMSLSALQARLIKMDIEPVNCVFLPAIWRLADAKEITIGPDNKTRSNMQYKLLKTEAGKTTVEMVDTLGKVRARIAQLKTSHRKKKVQYRYEQITGDEDGPKFMKKRVQDNRHGSRKIARVPK